MHDASTSPAQVFLGFDFGMRNIGVAVGQHLTKSASPLPPLLADHGQPNWDDITALINEWRPQALVVGVPLKMDNSEQRITAAARSFAKQLTDRYHLPAYEVDERLSTKEARQQIFAAGGYKALQKISIDSIAAKIILEQWLSES